ncbi:MAG: hypothetical protein IKP02_07635 [Paludibacteraceae bacterium]|nr:hypothetical protein [Paludibacteraceae bacterium]
MKISRMAHDKNEKRLRYKYYARIMERTERDLDLTGNWEFAGDYTFRPSPLNYCPECGRKENGDAN